MFATGAALRYFVALADELHFARTAKTLRISPPSLSQQISRLERQIGQPLFERSPQGVRLTRHGEELLPLARQVVRAQDAVTEWANRLTHPAVPLRLGIVASGAGRLTSEIVAEALQRQPGLRLELRRLGFFDAERELEGGHIDLAFVLGPWSPSAGLVGTPVLRERRVLVMRDDHPLAKKPTVTINETNGLGFVVPSAATGIARSWWLVDPRPDGSRPRVTATADDVEGLIELCLARVGVNIATRSVATHYGREGLAYLDIVDIEPAEVLLLRATDPSHPGVDLVEQIALELAGRWDSPH